VAALVAALTAPIAMAPSTALACDSYVSGYYRSNGTYVNGYYRSCANSTVTDNYTFHGNTNPYTYETGSDYYRSSPSSPYYNGGSSYGSSYGSSSSGYYGWP
jgi:hypothetical protein